MRSAFVLAGTLIVAGTWVVGARADGGTVRLSERKGPYHISVFTDPTPVRAGPVDISVLVQDRLGPLAPDAGVTIRASSLDHPDLRGEQVAGQEAATNKLFRAAHFDLPQPGRWRIEVFIDGPQGKADAAVDLEVAESLPRWWTFLGWIVWPLVPIAIFVLHQSLRFRQSGG